MRRMIVTLASAALLATPMAVAAPLASAPLAAADTTWTGGTHRQAIDFVIQRALSQRGVPFVYGGGNANGPSLPPASVTTAAAPVAQPTPQVGLQPIEAGVLLQRGLVHVEPLVHLQLQAVNAGGGVGVAAGGGEAELEGAAGC